MHFTLVRACESNQSLTSESCIPHHYRKLYMDFIPYDTAYSEFAADFRESIKELSRIDVPSSVRNVRIFDPHHIGTRMVCNYHIQLYTLLDDIHVAQK